MMTNFPPQNLALRIENSTKPEVAHKTISIQSLESIPKSVSTVSVESVHHEPEVVYVDRVVENYDVATGRDTLNVCNFSFTLFRSMVSIENSIQTSKI